MSGMYAFFGMLLLVLLCVGGYSAWIAGAAARQKYYGVSITLVLLSFAAFFISITLANRLFGS